MAAGKGGDALNVVSYRPRGGLGADGRQLGPAEGASSRTRRGRRNASSTASADQPATTALTQLLDALQLTACAEGVTPILVLVLAEPRDGAKSVDGAHLSARDVIRCTFDAASDAGGALEGPALEISPAILQALRRLVCDDAFWVRASRGDACCCPAGFVIDKCADVGQVTPCTIVSVGSVLALPAALLVASGTGGCCGGESPPVFLWYGDSCPDSRGSVAGYEGGGGGSFFRSTLASVPHGKMAVAGPVELAARTVARVMRPSSLHVALGDVLVGEGNPTSPKRHGKDATQSARKRPRGGAAASKRTVTFALPSGVEDEAEQVGAAGDDSIDSCRSDEEGEEWHSQAAGAPSRPGHPLSGLGPEDPSDHPDAVGSDAEDSGDEYIDEAPSVQGVAQLGCPTPRRHLVHRFSAAGGWGGPVVAGLGSSSPSLTSAILPPVFSIDHLLCGRVLAPTSHTIEDITAIVRHSGGSEASSLRPCWRVTAVFVTATRVHSCMLVVTQHSGGVVNARCSCLLAADGKRPTQRVVAASARNVSSEQNAVWTAPVSGVASAPPSSSDGWRVGAIKGCRHLASVWFLLRDRRAEQRASSQLFNQ